MKNHIEVGDIIEYQNKYLLVKTQKDCKGCFFDCERTDRCNKSSDFGSCYLKEETIIFKEISEIEKLILEGSDKNGN